MSQNFSMQMSNVSNSPGVAYSAATNSQAKRILKFCKIIGNCNLATQSGVFGRQDDDATTTIPSYPLYISSMELYFPTGTSPSTSGTTTTTSAATTTACSVCPGYNVILGISSDVSSDNATSITSFGDNGGYYVLWVGISPSTSSTSSTSTADTYYWRLFGNTLSPTNVNYSYQYNALIVNPAAAYQWDSSSSNYVIPTTPPSWISTSPSSLTAPTYYTLNGGGTYDITLYGRTTRIILSQKYTTGQISAVDTNTSPPSQIIIASTST